MHRMTTRIAIWASLVMVVFGGLALTGSNDGIPQGAYSSGYSQQQVPQAAGVNAADEPLDPNIPPGLESYAATEENGLDAPLDLLPAYRWNSDHVLYNNISPNEQFTAAIPNIVASITLGLAQIMWTVTLQLLNWALTVDVVEAFAITINEIFQTLSASLLSSGIVIFIFVAVMAVAAKLLISGKLSRSLMVILVFVVPVAGLQFMATQVAKAGDDQSTIPRWSPAWIAVEGSQFVNTIGSTALFALADRFSLTSVNDIEDSLAPTPAYVGGSGVGTITACPQYISALYERYNQLRNPVSATPVFRPGEVVDPNADNPNQTLVDGGYSISASNNAMVLASQMWERGYLNNFIIAQYDNVDQGKLMVCKQMEIQRGTPTDEAYAVVGAGAGIGGSFDDWGKRPFTTFTSTFDSTRAAQIFAWAACGGDNGTKAVPPWSYLGGVGAVGTGDQLADEQPNDTHCDNWAHEGLASPITASEGSISPQLFGNLDGTTALSEPKMNDERVLVPSNLDDAENATTARPEADLGGGTKLSPEQAAELSTLKDVFFGFWGHNSAQRQMGGLLAMLSAGIYLFTFGFLAVGVILAQIALVVLLAILPVTLLLAALPSEKKNTNPGVRLLKITGGMLLSKLVLMVTITLMVILTDIIIQMTTSMGRASSLLSALAPLAAFLILRYIYKQAGLGNILSPGGALGMTAGAATQALGDSKSAEKIRETGGAPQKAGSGLKNRYHNLKARQQQKAVAANAKAEMAERKKAREEKTKREETARELTKNPINPADPKAKEQLLQNSAKSQVEAQAALKAAAAGDAAALGAVIGGKADATTIGSSTAAGRRITDPQDVADVAILAAATPGVSRLDMAKRQEARLQDGLATIADEQGLDTPLALTEAQAEARRQATAQVSGVDPDRYMSDQLPLEPLLKATSAGGQFEVATDEHGAVNFELTRAQTGATNLLTRDTQADIEAMTNQLYEAYKAMYSKEDCRRAVTQTVLFDAGLADATGAEVDAFVACGFSDDQIKKVITAQASNPTLVVKGMETVGIKYEGQISSMGKDGWMEAMASSAEGILRNTSVNPVVSMEQATISLQRQPQVLTTAVEVLPKLAAEAKSPDPKVSKTALTQILQQLEELPTTLSDAERATYLVTANVALGEARLTGEDPTEIIVNSQQALSAVPAKEHARASQCSVLSSRIKAGEDPEVVLRELQFDLDKERYAAQQQHEQVLHQARSIHERLEEQKPRQPIIKPAPLPS